MKKVIIVGGGAAGFFTAINIAEQCSNTQITIVEASKNVLQKVKISGGGRCNVTHACFDPKELVTFYPRGAKELLGPFHKFMTGDTMEWFENKGVPLTIEDDGRIFPKANTSQAIIDCFLQLVATYKIEIIQNFRVDTFFKKEEQWWVQSKDKSLQADSLVITSGSNAKIWKILENLGQPIVSAVPSLFTFQLNDSKLKDLSGISVPLATIKVSKSNLENNGALLITHRGLSGPAVLKTSAFGAIELAKLNYQFTINVNWLSIHKNNALEKLQKIKHSFAKNKVFKKIPFNEIPKRLWEYFMEHINITSSNNWGDMSNHQLESIATVLTEQSIKVVGKNTFKEEFVTAGGVDLKHINCQRFESKKLSNLFFAGEVLNIDGVTGGFNFQNAWTTSWIVSKSIH